MEEEATKGSAEGASIAPAKQEPQDKATDDAPGDLAQIGQCGPATPTQVEGQLDKGEPSQERPDQQDWEREIALANLALAKKGLSANRWMAFFAFLAFAALVYQIRSAETDSAESKARSIAAVEAATSAAKAATNSAETAQNSLEFARSQAQIEQRARIGIASVEYIAVQAGVQAAFDVQFANSGKTPAFKVRARTGRQLLWKNERVIPDYNLPEHSRGRMMVQPGTNYGLTFKTERPLSEDEVADIKAGNLRFYVYGRIEYVDVFRVDHYTEFCFYLAPELRGATACPTHDDAN